MLLTDIIDLIKLKPKPLEHYSQYPLALTVGIILLILLAGVLTTPPDPELSTMELVIVTLIIVPLYVIPGMYFLRYWLNRKDSIVSLKALFNVWVLAGMLGILYIPLELMQLPYGLDLFLFLSLLAYPIVIWVVAIAKGANVSVGYVVGGELLFHLIIVVFAIFLLGLATLLYFILVEPPAL